MDDRLLGKVAVIVDAIGIGATWLVDEEMILPYSESANVSIRDDHCDVRFFYAHVEWVFVQVFLRCQIAPQRCR